MQHNHHVHLRIRATTKESMPANGMTGWESERTAAREAHSVHIAQREQAVSQTD